MSDSKIEKLIDGYCAVWNEPDAARRREMLDAVWTADATYSDPGLDAAIAGGLVAHIERIRQSRPGATVERCGPVDHHHGFARFPFQVRLPDGTVIRRGIDIADLTAGGTRISRIVGFFDEY